MKLIQNIDEVETSMQGIAHRTIASHRDGLTGLSVWHQKIAVGMATPDHWHECSEVIVCEQGWGRVESDEGTLRFSAGMSVAIPGCVVHQIFNDGQDTLVIRGILAASPVEVFHPDGKPLPLPWIS
ncbi:cupin domain-containing protein [Achromobacter sp. SD115]|uniref:cupin domain-containing protein n=1 Tax=Achromobacter sp. SD115 TaxID=2782011 RepID=UPI001A95D98A|nr:cupin domain-containing protein [Achromobacter sp. SD115]MBO1012000.1 cupin domain-containing protein [Achromobacter sp. SD115]